MQAVSVSFVHIQAPKGCRLRPRPREALGAYKGSPAVLQSCRQVAQSHPRFIASCFTFISTLFIKSSFSSCQNLDVSITANSVLLNNRALARKNPAKAITTPSSHQLQAKNKASPTTLLPKHLHFLPCCHLSILSTTYNTAASIPGAVEIVFHIHTARLVPN